MKRVFLGALLGICVWDTVFPTALPTAWLGVAVSVIAFSTIGLCCLILGYIIGKQSEMK